MTSQETWHLKIRRAKSDTLSPRRNALSRSYVWVELTVRLPANGRLLLARATPAPPPPMSTLLKKKELSKWSTPFHKLKSLLKFQRVKLTKTSMRNCFGGMNQKHRCETVLEVRTRKFRCVLWFLLARWGTTFFDSPVLTRWGTNVVRYGGILPHLHTS